MSNMTIALAGNPNCGKTTLFNTLTGASQYVGNWPGVTVEKKEGRLKAHKDITIQDLPGIYSLSPYTLEEVVTRDYLVTGSPDLIINLVDAGNLERNLYLTTQLCELGIPVIVAQNMMDVVQKRGDTIDTAQLSRFLGCPVVEISALKGSGIKKLTEEAVKTVTNASTKAPIPITFPDDIEKALAKTADIIGPYCPEDKARWYTIKAFERDKKVLAELPLTPGEKANLSDIAESPEKEYDDDAESIITGERYNAIGEIVSQCSVKARRGGMTVSDKIDRIITNRWLGLPIFAFVMWAVYYISIQTIGAYGTDWANDSLFGEYIPEWTTALLESMNCAEWLQSLILDGIIAGVGAVLGFLPQMAVLFLCLGLLEDCGYMARVAFIMDRLFRRFGLSGKSFIPMLVSMGCGVPGIMATRTIENEKDRRMTIMVTTFIPCGAKTPIIALIAGAFFPDSSWVAPSAYFIGIAAIILSGLILKKSLLFAGDPAPFVMELPLYHTPAWKNVIVHAWDRCKSFVQKAGSIIFLASAIIWFLSSYTWTMNSTEENESMLADIGNVAAPVFQPLGWGDWKPTVATVTGLIAKENVVGTFGVLYAEAEDSAESEANPEKADDSQASAAPDEGEVDEEEQEIQETGSKLARAGAFTTITAFSFMIFNLLCAPCFAAIGAIRREMNSAKWTWFAIGYMCLLAYVIAFLVNQFGAWLYENAAFGIGQILAFAVLAGIIWLLVRKPSLASR